MQTLLSIYFYFLNKDHQLTYFNMLMPHVCFSLRCLRMSLTKEHMLVTFSSKNLCIIYHYLFYNPCYKFNDVSKKITRIWNNSNNLKKHLYTLFKQVTKIMLIFYFFSYFVDCKSWLNWLMDDHHLGYSANLKKNSNMLSISRVFLSHV